LQCKKKTILFKMKKFRNSILAVVAIVAISFTSCSKSGNTAEADAAQVTADSLMAAEALADSLAQIEVPMEVMPDSTAVVDSVK
jgi:hypothetical protein